MSVENTHTQQSNKSKSPVDEQEGSSEWGWEHTPIESDDSYADVADRQNVQVSLDSSGHNKDLNSTTGSPVKPKMASTGKLAHSNNSSTHTLNKGMTSSPSFQELEKAIGQTLALGLNASDSSSSLNSEQDKHYNRQRMSLQRSRSFGKQQQILRPYSNSNMQAVMAMPAPPNARAELDAFINEYESRALILFHNPNLNPVAVRNAAQKCGVLYYIRPEFHGRYGVTLLSYFDLRSAIHAHSTLARQLGADDSASAHFSVMLHAGAGTNSEEFRLLVQKVPSHHSEAEIEARFSQFGELRSIQKLFGDAQEVSDSGISYSVEYYNIQDARLAASELSATIGQFWGPSVEISFAPLDSRKQTLCRQLLATLSRWRAELAAVASYNQPPQMMMGGGGYPPQMMVDQRNMMMMAQQQYHYPMQQPLMYPPQMDYAAMEAPQQFYPMHHGNPYADPMYAGHGGWQPESPGGVHPAMHHAPVPAPPPKMSPAQMHHIKPASMPMREHYPASPSHHQAPQIQAQQVHDNRPLHHNGGHGLTRKPKANGADAEYLVDLDQSGDRRTTLMIRNIPNKYSQQMLLEEINQHHEGKYDFFYLPIDFKNRCNVGYAFISFLDAAAVAPFIREFEGQRWNNFNSDKVCTISYARIQGKAAMISRFQNSSLLEKDDEYRPLLFYSEGPNKGKPEPFPMTSRRGSGGGGGRYPEMDGGAGGVY